MRTVGIIAYAEAFSGGIYQYTMSMIDALRLDGSCRYVIVTRPENHQFDNTGLEIRRLPTLGLLRKIGNTLLLALRWRKPWFFTRAQRALLADIDIFISPTITPYPLYFFPRPFVFTFHDMQERYYPEFFGMFDRLMRFLYGRGLAHDATRIVTESRYVRKDLETFLGVTEERVAVLPAPPPTAFLDREPTPAEMAAVREKYRLPETYAFYPAQIWLHKNHRTLLDALHLLREKHPDLHLVLTGTEYSGKELLGRKIRELGLQDRVRYLGYVDYDELPAVYRLSRLLVMPSLFESISIPVYEAFSLGVPVACSNVVALPEQVGDAGLLFDPLDAADIAAKVGMILDQPTLAQELSRKGRARMGECDHERYALQLRDLIESIGGLG